MKADLAQLKAEHSKAHADRKESSRTRSTGSTPRSRLSQKAKDGARRRSVRRR